MIKNLPTSSFVDVRLNKIVAPITYWSADLHNKIETSKYAYGIPLSDQERQYFSSTDTIIAKADRYGGNGIGVNGGSGRCAEWDGMLVKGIGPTNLVGSGTPFWHSYGGASLREAIKELIWGEIFDLALPHGAVKITHVIGVGSNVPLHYPDYYGRLDSPRVLILRESFVRPAHFMRATYFDPLPNFHKDNCNDVVRTKNALAAFKKIFGDALPNQYETLIQALWAMYSRFGEQISAARAKCLIHGSLFPSNITIEGKFLDFGMSSAISDFGRPIIAKGCPDAWEQHQPIIQSIKDIFFYIDKYLDIRHPNLNLATQEFISQFLEYLQIRFEREILCLMGMPRFFADNLGTKVVRKLSLPALRIMNAKNNDPFKLLSPCKEFVPHMPEKMGEMALRKVIRIISACKDEIEAESRLNKEIPSSNLRESFINSFYELMSLTSLKFENENKYDIECQFRFNAARQNSNLNFLYVAELNKNIDSLELNSDSIKRFVDSRIKNAKLIVGKNENQNLRNEIIRATGQTVSSHYSKNSKDDSTEYSKYSQIIDSVLEK